jgi:hypothetical protein
MIFALLLFLTPVIFVTFWQQKVKRSLREQQE